MGDRPPWYPNKRPQRRRRRGEEGDLEESVVFEKIPPTAPGDTRSDRGRERRRGAEWSLGMTNSTEPIGRRQLRRATHRAEEVLMPGELSLFLFCIHSCLRN